ncbi:cation:proton antiporter [Pseudomonas sp. MIL19]|uniref:cation:proton antiporter family protein n=1 Tax=Pseudomonas sp. MIL19 TaxID=2976979 RepID=UPI0023643BB3|nr:cation:proton antiporter family protein [Pseudomonas sp. MIL19]MBU0884973.1 cation:proton antiporter [Gammaproteobacteria bacterium]MBU0901084.1 cation:proton antiporter [Gammaproteobacteria bacterium]MBU1859774.1 cation:proton antiporter [Gammaproteobacteria bacterium]MDD2161646.1 cation:proton antiporter [Pseudomonas sp. MIL19]
MIEAAWIAFAFGMGLAARIVGLPPLVGYLGAGFALAAVGEYIGVGPHDSEALQHIAHLGVLLLLFTVGLKLKPSNLLRREVIGGGLLHFAISSVLFLPAIRLLLDLPWLQCLLLASALSFSSTVLAAKVLESKRELRAFHGRVAIGVLVLQDMIALLVMSLAAGDLPSPWALLVFALPFLRPLLFRLLDASGHEELLLLLGLLLALAVGGFGFEQLGLSSELGALAFGALLAKHKRATELSNSLWGIKEVFLVGFFLQIGIGGLPDADALKFALVMTLLLPLKGVLFFFLFLLFRLRARSAFLAGVSLTNYSEFGLIMASVVLPQWLIPLAITVALSFVVSAPLNRIVHLLYERWSWCLIPLERNIRHPDEQPLSLGDAQTLVMGMGRTGRAAYDYLKEQGYRVVGLDSDPTVIEQSKAAGRHVLFADGEDPVFWQHLDMPKVDAVILTLNDEETKVIATQKLRERGFSGLLVSHAMYEDIAKRIQEAGADRTYLTMSEAGSGLAEHVIRTLESRTEAS